MISPGVDPIIFHRGQFSAWPRPPNLDSPMRQRSGYLVSQIAQDFEFRVSLTRVEINPAIVTQRILAWTNGEPFLTYRLYELILQGPLQRPDHHALDREGRWVDAYVQTQLIDRCRDPELIKHLRGICRCLIEDPRSTQMLRLYRAVLAGRSLRVNLMNYVQRRLVQSGVVRICDDDEAKPPSLVVGNRYYGAIFNQAWLARAFKTVDARLRQEAVTAIAAVFDQPLPGPATPDPLAMAQPSKADQPPESTELPPPAISQALHPELRDSWAPEILPVEAGSGTIALSAAPPRRGFRPSGATAGPDDDRLVPSATLRRLALAMVACSLGALTILLLAQGQGPSEEEPPLELTPPSMLEIRNFLRNIGR